MKVFISYSTDDISLVRKIADQIKPYTEVLYWDQSKMPGEQVWDQIFSWIDQCDAVVAVITDKTVSRGISVGQEIGRAKGKEKSVFPMVAQDVPAVELGCLHGVTYIRMERDNPGAALQAIAKRISEMTDQIKVQNFWTVVIGIILVSWLLSNSKK